MTSLINTTFGENIRVLRIQNELTLTQLAFKLGLDSANLSKIENGKRDFDEKRLPQLAKVFKLNLRVLKSEYIVDKLAKQICQYNCTREMLIVAEEKAKYRKKIKLRKEKNA